MGFLQNFLYSLEEPSAILLILQGPFFLILILLGFAGLSKVLFWCSSCWFIYKFVSYLSFQRRWSQETKELDDLDLISFKDFRREKRKLLASSSRARTFAGASEAVATKTTVLPHQNRVLVDNIKLSQVRALLAKQRTSDAAARVEHVRCTESEVGQLRGQQVAGKAIPPIPAREREIVDDGVLATQMREDGVSPNLGTSDSVVAVVRSEVVCQADRESHEELFTASQPSEVGRTEGQALEPVVIKSTISATDVVGSDDARTLWTSSFELPNDGESHEELLTTNQLREEVEDQAAVVFIFLEEEFDQPISVESVVIDSTVTTIDVVGLDDARTPWTSSFELPSETLPGTQVAAFSLVTTTSGTGSLARRLSLALRYSKCPEVQLCCKLPLNDGLSPAVVYGQCMSTRMAYVLKSVLPMGHRIWDPGLTAVSA